MNSLQKIGGALVLSTTLLSGCSENPTSGENNHIRVTRETCARSMNLISTNPENPNQHDIHWKGILVPVIRECSSEIEGNIHINSKNQYERPEHFKTNPDAGKIIDSNFSRATSPIITLISELVPPLEKSPWVKPFVTSSNKPKITLNGSIVGSASAEGFTDGGNSELWNRRSDSINTRVAYARANQLENTLLNGISAKGINVISENIKKSAQVMQFSDAEKGQLAVMAESRFPRQSDTLIKLFSDFNAGKIPKKDPIFGVIEKIVSDKRFAEANLSIVGQGMKTRIEPDIPTNSAIWGSIIGLGIFGAKRKKISKT